MRCTIVARRPSAATHQGPAREQSGHEFQGRGLELIIELVGHTPAEDPPGADGRGSIIANKYDALNRKTEQHDTALTGPLLASWVFDTLAKGQLTSSSSYTGSVAGTPGLAYTTAVTSYDAAYRPTATTTTIPVGAPAFGGTSYTEQLSYFIDGQPNLLKVPAAGGLPAESLRYSYGGDGRLGGMRSATANYVLIGYTPLGQVSNYSRTATTSESTTYGYDQATGQMLHITDGTTTGSTYTLAADRTFTRDNSGDITSVATTATGVANETQCFGYDYLQNLTAAWTPSSANCATAPTSSSIGGPAPYWNTYAVDSVTGNRTATTAQPITSGGTATTSTYTYPAAAGVRPHAVSSISQQVGAGTPSITTYGYDNSGNTTLRPGQTLTYNSLGKLSQVTVGSSTQSNIYDASGNLLLRTDSVTGATLFLGMTELRTAAGSTVASGLRTYTVNGTVIGERNTTAGVGGSTLKWVASDTVGSSLIEIDATTGVITRRYMDPYGLTRGTPTVWSSNHSYLNAPASTTTGLTHLGAREFDPVLGRFTSVDSILSARNPQQNNGYSYAQNNPVSLSDPTGLEPKDKNGNYDGVYYTPGNGTTKGAGAPPPAPGSGPADFWGGVGSTLYENTIGTDLKVAGGFIGAAGETAAAIWSQAPINFILQAIFLGPGAAWSNFKAMEANTAVGILAAIHDPGGAVVGVLNSSVGLNEWGTDPADALGRTLFTVALFAAPGGAAIKGTSAAAKIEDLGIVYQRIDLTGGLKPYVGQTMSDARFLARQAEHARDHPNADFDFEILGHATPGNQLDRLEEFFIRQAGGPTNASNAGGALSNLRHQMSDSRYSDAGGDPFQ